MNDVSVLVDHNVAIVSILDLQNVADQRVGSHALDEVGTSLKTTNKQTKVIHTKKTKKSHTHKKQNKVIHTKKQKQKTIEYGLSRVHLYLLKPDRVVVSIHAVKVRVKTDLSGLAYLVPRLGVWHALYHSTLQQQAKTTQPL